MFSRLGCVSIKAEANETEEITYGGFVVISDFERRSTIEESHRESRHASGRRQKIGDAEAGGGEAEEAEEAEVAERRRRTSALYFQSISRVMPGAHYTCFRCSLVVVLVEMLHT